MTLFLAGNYIDATAVPSPYYWLEWITGGNISENPAWGHLQLVYGSSLATGLEIEVQSPRPGAYWEFPNIRFHAATTPVQATPHIGQSPTHYIAVELDWTSAGPLLPGSDRTDADIWSIWEQAHVQFQDQAQFPYLPSLNSNSYASTLLALTGFDVADVIDMATPTYVTAFPGAGVDVLANSWWGPDLRLAGGEHGDVIYGGAGDDVIPGHDVARAGFASDQTP